MFSEGALMNMMIDEERWHGAKAPEQGSVTEQAQDMAPATEQDVEQVQGWDCTPWPGDAKPPAVHYWGPDFFLWRW